MADNNTLDKILYGVVKIINIINIILVFGVIFAFLEINKYIAFIMLFIMASFIVFISRKFLDELIYKDNISIEGTLVFKILAIISLLMTFLYFIFKGEWLLLLIYVLLTISYQVFLMYVKGKNILF